MRGTAAKAPATLDPGSLESVLRGGLEAGDTLLVHAGLKSVGWLDGGPECLIRVLLDSIGPSGNLVMPTSSRQFVRTGFFDVLETPSDVGLLSETFRTWPGVRRSLNPMASFAALGPQQDQFLQRFDAYLDECSPFSALLALDGKVLLYGVDFDKCTLFHLSEERVGAPYNHFKTFSGVVRDYEGLERATSQTYFVRRDMTQKKDPRPVGRRFELDGAVYSAPVGDGRIRIFRARDFDRYCDRAIADDPEVFLAHGAQRD